MSDRPSLEPGSAEPIPDLGHRPELDGLRGIAVALVLAGHIFYSHSHVLGVDLFFVLSGFLITTLLLEELDRTGKISIGSFYWRRALRLLPALGVFVLLCVSIADYVPTLQNWSNDLIYVLTYTLNIALVLGYVEVTTGFGHCWSLALEEQFYLIWPWIVLFLVTTLKVSRRTLVWTLGSMIVMAEVWRQIVIYHNPTFVRVFFGPDCRGHVILMGCFLAALRRCRGPSKEARWYQELIMIALAFTPLFITGMSQYTSLNTVFGIVLAIFVWGTVRWQNNLLTSIMKLSPLRWLGKISYGVYLFHFPIYFLIETQVKPGEMTLGDRILVLSATLFISIVSFFFVEKKFLDYKKLGWAALRDDLMMVKRKDPESS